MIAPLPLAASPASIYPCSLSCVVLVSLPGPRPCLTCASRRPQNGAVTTPSGQSAGIRGQRTVLGLRSFSEVVSGACGLQGPKTVHGLAPHRFRPPKPRTGARCRDGEPCTLISAGSGTSVGAEFCARGLRREK